MLWYTLEILWDKVELLEVTGEMERRHETETETEEEIETETDRREMRRRRQQAAKAIRGVEKMVRAGRRHALNGAVPPASFSASPFSFSSQPCPSPQPPPPHLILEMLGRHTQQLSLHWKAWRKATAINTNRQGRPHWERDTQVIGSAFNTLGQHAAAIYRRNGRKAGIRQTPFCHLIRHYYY